jgi:aryl-alcohol dehydrogenase-like predicted oxidoreductase
MRTQLLGKNGPRVSAMGLGCMGMSDFYGSRRTRDEAESLATLQAALDAGINFLDTGDFYGMGHNEMLIARAILGRSERPIISVKFGAQRSPSGAFLGFDGRPPAVKTFAAYSLQRLGVEAIDIYQPSRVDPKVPIEETVGAVADLIREGKVRYLGISEANEEQIRRAHAVHPVTALQIEYSLATRFIESRILPTVRELGIGLVAYGVVSRGLLTGALPDSLGPEDFRSHLPRFQGESYRRNLDKVRLLQAMAAERGCSAAQLAFAWLLSRGEGILPLIGTSRRTRLAENLGALQISLTRDELAKLDQAFPNGSMEGDRYPAEQMGIVAG